MTNYKVLKFAIFIKKICELIDIHTLSLLCEVLNVKAPMPGGGRSPPRKQASGVTVQ